MATKKKKRNAAKLLTAHQAAQLRNRLEKQGYHPSVTFVGYKPRKGGGQQPMYGVTKGAKSAKQNESVRKAKKRFASVPGMGKFKKKKKNSRPKTKSTARSKPNPGAKLKASISQMKPNTWYPSTLAGAKVKVKRKGMGLEIKPIGKRKRSR